MNVNSHAIKAIVLLLLCAIAFTLAAEGTLFAREVQVDVAAQRASLLSQLDQAGVRVSYHAETGMIRFIGASPDAPVPQPSTLATETTAEAAALNFLETYGVLFGLEDARKELSLMRARDLEDGRSSARFQQLYRGIPVMGGEVTVQMGSGRKILSAAGELLPALSVNTTPRVDPQSARQIGLGKVAKDFQWSVSDLVASEPELWIYSPFLLGGPGPRINSLVWRMEVTPVELAPIRQLVLVDAHLGAVVLSFNQIHTAKNRKTYDANNGTTLPGTLRCNESNPGCSGGDSHEVAAHVFAGDTYDFYLSEHGRDSIDNAGMTLTSTVHYDNNYQNAFWNGTQMVYGDGHGYPLADDVVAHELTHGVTEHESGLFYFYQSGAINESFSDVWGEFVDIKNGNNAGDTPWELGEDVSGLGALRNMQNPPLFNDPDRMGSGLYYCNQSELSNGSGDNGGVHINSGVNNKAVFLMTDGGSFNGRTVTALGYVKVADLYYEVQTNMLTSAADYADLYDALIQASINLGWSAADRQEVKDALDAVEMNQLPAGCSSPPAPVCTSGTPVSLFTDDIESGGGNWAAGSNQGGVYWFVPQTTETIGLNGPYATSGVGNIWGFDQGQPIGGVSDTYLAMNLDVAIPANSYLRFNHSFGFESSTPTGTFKYDGGILEYSTNSGSTWTNAGALFTHNGYNGTLQGSNPLGAIPAFAADSRGYISSRVDLSTLAGQSVRFRFRIGTDSDVYDFGWFIDDVTIYACSTGVNSPPTIAGIPDQSVSMNGSADNAVDLWAYTLDLQDSDASLTFSIANSPAISAGITLDSNRYIDINPITGWTGTTNVTVQARDTGGLTDTDTFEVRVKTNVVYVPVMLGCWPLTPQLDPINNGDGDGIYTLTWSWPSCAPASPSQYELQVDDNASFTSPSTINAGTATSRNDYRPTPGTYYWRVRAFASGAWSQWSNIQSVVVNGLHSHLWIDNQTGQDMTVEIVNIEQRLFSTGRYFWRSLPKGMYQYRATGWCGSTGGDLNLSANETTLTFHCALNNAFTPLQTLEVNETAGAP